MKRIIEELHHGKISVFKSQNNKGTTFKIILNKKVKSNIHYTGVKNEYILVFTNPAGQSSGIMAYLPFS